MSRERWRGARLKPPPDGVEFRRKRRLAGLPLFSPRFDAIDSVFIYTPTNAACLSTQKISILRDIQILGQFCYSFSCLVLASVITDVTVRLLFCIKVTMVWEWSLYFIILPMQATLYLASNTMDRVSSWFSDHAESTVIFLPR
ncbi:unnamed protein product [Musa textilis]